MHIALPLMVLRFKMRVNYKGLFPYAVIFLTCGILERNDLLRKHKKGCALGLFPG